MIVHIEQRASIALAVPVSNVHVYVMKKKPCFHDGAVTVEMLAEIPPSDGEPPDDGLTRFQ